MDIKKKVDIGAIIKKFKALIAAALVLATVGSLYACRKKPEDKFEQSAGIGIVHPEAPKYVVPQLNALGSTEGIVATRDITIGFPNKTERYMPSVTDKWTLKNTTDEDRTITVAYVCRNYSEIEPEFLLDGEKTDTVKLLGRFDPDSGTELRAYRSKIETRDYLKSALEPSAALDEDAFIYDMSGIFDKLNIPEEERSRVKVSVRFEYDPEVTGVYFLLESGEFSFESSEAEEDDTEDAAPKTAVTIDLIYGVDKTNVFLITGEDIEEHLVITENKDGEPEEKSVKAEREQTTIAEALGAFAKDYYMEHISDGKDPEENDTTLEDTPYESYVNLVRKLFSEFDAVGVLSRDLTDRRSDFYDLNELFDRPESSMRYISKEIVIPAQGSAEVQVTVNVNAGQFEYLGGNAADFDCDIVNVTFDWEEDLRFDWLLSDMGFVVKKGIKQVVIDPTFEGYFLAYGDKNV